MERVTRSELRFDDYAHFCGVLEQAISTKNLLRQLQTLTLLEVCVSVCAELRQPRIEDKS